MRDGDVRRVLMATLRDEHARDPDCLLVPELAMCGRVRVDVAVVNGFLGGYEIKSARDTLRRLPAQVSVYSELLDFACLVVAKNHLEAAQEVLPMWWGVVVATGNHECVELTTVRPADRNPFINKSSLVQLLWRDEALAELSIRDADAGFRSKPRAAIWHRLACMLSVDELRSVVRDRLKRREGWRPALQLRADGGK